MPQTLHLISHVLCPYVQRAAIVLAEKGAVFTRTDIDLSSKPDWFLAISPLGKTPVLTADDRPIFESAVILEYLDDTLAPRLHPQDAFERARHRSWVEFASAVLNDVAGLYNAPDKSTFAAKAAALAAKFVRIEPEIAGPWFGGASFSMVDAAFGPVFRYFDVLDQIGDFGILAGKPRLAAWRGVLAARPSVRAAASPDYPRLLSAFLERRPSHLGRLAAIRSVRISAQ